MAIEMTQSAERPIDRWFSAYSADHQDARNQLLHVICVPAIVWSVMALLYSIPVGEALPAGSVAWIAAVLTMAFWLRLSISIGVGAALCMLASLGITEYVRVEFGVMTLALSAITVFVVAWIGQFIGHAYEGKRPSFFTDLVYLLIGPIWVLGKFYRRQSWRF
jgi:uncharacterized membrane protein YGL010W